MKIQVGGNLYLFVTSCEYEKRLWTEQVTAPIKDITRYDATETSPMMIKDEVRAPSLWGGKRVIVIEQIDKVKPLGPYLDLLDRPAPDVVLIFMASSSKPVAELVQKGKKALIVVDMSQEKPWDKERRLQEWLRSAAHEGGKQLHSEVAAEMIRHLGTDLATLDQELKKLITYVGDKSIVERQDVEAICGAKDLTTGWQLAETLVWKKPIALGDKMTDLGFVFPFLGQVRYHLQLGAQIADLIERQTADLKKHFPTQRNLDKFIPIAKERGSSFFIKALLKLYDFELLAKSAPLDLSIMFDIFQCKVHEKTHSAS